MLYVFKIIETFLFWFLVFRCACISSFDDRYSLTNSLTHQMEIDSPIPPQFSSLRLRLWLKRLNRLNRLIRPNRLNISDNLSPSQYGGKRGTGTEHVIVNFVDRILQMLERYEKSTAIVSYADWRGAFERQDPTITINKFIKLGVRSSLIPILIDYLRNRKI